MTAASRWLIRAIEDRDKPTERDLMAEAIERFSGTYDWARLTRDLKRLRRDGLAEKYRVPGSNSAVPHVWRLTEAGRALI